MLIIIEIRKNILYNIK